MIHRALAIFLALLLCWSGFTTQEQVLTASTGDRVEVSLSEETREPLHDGSVDDHHLDDQPGHAQVEGAMDLPALVTTLPSVTSPSLTMSRPGPHARAPWVAPYLDGPQRPPCATLLLS